MNHNFIVAVSVSYSDAVDGGIRHTKHFKTIDGSFNTIEEAKLLAGSFVGPISRSQLFELYKEEVAEN
jgi:hypothetical protein